MFQEFKKSASHIAISLTALITVSCASNSPPKLGDFSTDEDYQAAYAEHLEEVAQDEYDAGLLTIPNKCERLQGVFETKAAELRVAEWTREKEIKHDNTDRLKDTVDLYTGQDQKVKRHKEDLNKTANDIIKLREKLLDLHEPEKGRSVFPDTLAKCSVPKYYGNWGIK